MSEEAWKARVQRNKAERLRRLAGHNRLVITVSSLLFEADPMGIASEPDEYDMEAEIISIQLLGGLTEAALPAAVHETFVSCFDAVAAGAAKRHDGIAAQIWEAWRAYREPAP